MRRDTGSLRPLVFLCFLGVGLLLGFLLVAHEIDFPRDEGRYIYLAISWNHFRFYSDSYRYR